MFERYTEKARRVIFFARYEASELGSEAIEPHHLLLGLIREDKQLFTRFSNLTSLDTLVRRIRETAGQGTTLSASVDMPLSREAKRVLSYAADESEKLNHGYIGTEHLLLGLLRAEETTAAELLSEYGLSFNIVRNALSGATGTTKPSKPDYVEEMRGLAAEAFELAAAIAEKAERIEEICEQLTKDSADQKGDGG